MPAAWRPAGRGRSDAAFIVSWLIRLVVVLALAAAALFEVATVMFARVSASDTASKAAEEAGFVYRSTADLRRAEVAAREEAAAGGAVLDRLTINAQARTATVTLHKRAKTLVMGRFEAFEKYTTATATETAPLPS